MSGLSLYDKVWQAHVVREADGQALLYIDRHLIHEVTSPQPFDGLRLAGRKPWRVDAVQAVTDHNVPTLHPERELEDAASVCLDGATRGRGLCMWSARSRA